MASSKKKMSQEKMQQKAEERAIKQAKQRKNAIIAACACVVLAVIVVLVVVLVRGTTPSTAPNSGSSSVSEETSAVFSENAVYTAEIDVRDYGVITVELDSKAAPETVKNFVELAQRGFYDGLTFHRIISGFMMQGGDPEGTGTGGSGKTIKGEFSANGVENPLSHTRGAISMARSKANDSASSQFFIVHEDSTFLDGQYAAFGYVTDGMDVVDKVCADAKPTDDNGTIPAEEQPVITSITIHTK